LLLRALHIRTPNQTEPCAHEAHGFAGLRGVDHHGPDFRATMKRLGGEGG
jgi:hypothetical protein